MGDPGIELVDGCHLRYRLRGQGAALALTPGGRVGMDLNQPLADPLAEHCRLLEWDRRNTGGSDLYFGPDERCEQEIWADDLAQLLVRLDLAPAYLAGGSAGARVSVLTAIRHPEVVSGLILWSVSGGAYGSQVLGYSYHVPFIEAAQRGGMEAVIDTPFFAERIAEQPANRERLLALEPEAFIDVLKRWNAFFYHRAEAPMTGATRDELRAIEVPALVFAGNDDIHPGEAAAGVAECLPKATLVPCPWTRDEWMDIYTGRSPGSVFDLYPRMLPMLLDWLPR